MKIIDRNNIIKSVIDIFANILDINTYDIDVKNTFFCLGGDSLRLINLIEAIRNNFSVNLDIRLLFKRNSVKNIADLISFYLRHPKLCHIEAKNIPAQESFKLSFEQDQIWLAHNASKNKSLYNVPWIIEIKGNLDEKKLYQSLEKISLEQRLLKCSIMPIQDSPELKAQQYVPLNFESFESNETTIHDEINTIIEEPFDLEIAPLYRFRLIKTTNRYLLCCVFHHIIVDSQSLIIFSNKLSNLYNNKKSNKDFTTYNQYVANQNTILKKGLPKQVENYWRASINNDEFILRFPKKAHITPYAPDYKVSSSITFNVGNEILEKAKKYSDFNNITVFSFFYSIFSLIISRLANKNDFIISIPCSTRLNSDFSETFGPFINLLPFKNTIDTNDEFASYAKKTFNNLIKLYRNRYISQTAIQLLSSLNREDFNQVFNVAFSIDHEISPKLDRLDTKILPASYVSSKFDLTFFLKINESDRPRVLIEYNKEKFTPDIITSIFESFCYVSEFAFLNPKNAICNVPLIKQNKFSIAENKHHSNNETILHMFERISNKFPKNTALDYKGKSLNFHDLDKKSNQFAQYLKKVGFTPADTIAIKMNHSIEMIICILGILKARCVYVPIHVDTPKDRVKYILSQSNSKAILINQSSYETSTDISKINVKNFFNDSHIYSDQLKIENTTDDLAYIIFTSGSTGDPKGVMISHGNLANLFSQADMVFSFDSNDRWLLFHSYAFDFSVWEIFGALLNGARLTIPDEKLIKSPEYLYKLIIQKNITILNQTPSAFTSFSIEAIKNVYNHKLPLKYIIFGGEAINTQLIMNWGKYFSYSQHKLINMYGITEGTIHVTYQILDEKSIKETSHGSPIGKPLLGGTVLLLDENKMEVPVGFSGEIYIAGRNVAQGYVNQNTLTAERFIYLDQLNDHEKFYRTSDIAIKKRDETLSYIGRNDTQIKIRGYRIELKEIEAVLMQSAYIDDVAIQINDKNELYKTLTAFIVPSHKNASTLLKITSLKNNKDNHLTTLPNGLTIADVNPSETLSLYHEIFITKQYHKKGIQLNDDSVIFDVGANIGLFSLSLGLANRKFTIYAFEPFKKLCDCLEKNNDIYDLDITVKCIGLSDSPGIRKFAYFDKVTSMSTYDYDTNDQNILLRSAIKANNHDFVEEIVNDKLIPQYVDCHVETISEQIDNYSLQKIDLLKVDAEGAELDILMGINNHHWNIISQIIIEVHNTNNKLTTIINLLESKGFVVEFDRDEIFLDTNLYMVYATKLKGEKYFHIDSSLNIIASESHLVARIQDSIQKKLPEYMHPTYYKVIQEIPKTINGKTNYKQLNAIIAEERMKTISENSNNSTPVIQTIKKTWEKLLDQEIKSIEDNFFDLGGTSLLAIHATEMLATAFNSEINVIDIFNYPTIQKLSNHIETSSPARSTSGNQVNQNSIDDIAIIGIEGKFPNADNIHSFWHNLITSKNCLTHFLEEQCGYNIKNGLVPVAGVIENIYDFDAEFFKISPLEATFLDPQQRLLLETCYLSLLNANVDLKENTDRIGVFAAIDQSKYIDLFDKNTLDRQKCQLIDYSNSRDFVATRIAYKLGLTGPAMTISTACSSSLSACIQAANSLLRNECDIAIVCASSLVIPELLPGYFYEPEGIMSKDGICAPFDFNSSGTIPGSAVVSIILKRREDAIKNNDTIIASIHSYSINNDGNDKAGYIAPSVSGQIKCLENTYKKLNGNLDALDFVETHGTGTKLGDAIEIKALSDVFSNRQKNKVYLGSVKANIGHAGAASGLCGLIKTALVLNKKEIPPQINFSKWNDLFNYAENIFQINTTPVKLGSGVRYAGVSSFGMGGTNAHLLLKSEEIKSPYKNTDNASIFKNRKYFYNNPNVRNINAPTSTIEEETILERIAHLDFIKDLLSLVESELAIAPIKLEDNFFDLGGDSLISLSILSKIQEKYKIAISIDDFYASENIEKLIATVLKNGNKNVPRYNVLSHEGNESFVLIHPGGGSVYPYEFFKGLSQKQIKVFTIENQVLNDIDSTITSIELMASHYISLLDADILKGNITLGGWSFGGNVAYEMAYQLQMKGIAVQQVIMFDSWARYPQKYNNFDVFKDIWFTKLDQSYHYDDNLWKKMLWKRLKMLINYEPNCSHIKIKLYKAMSVDSDLVIKNDSENFWADISKNIDVISVDATHHNILDSIQTSSLLNDLLDK